MTKRNVWLGLCMAVLFLSLGAAPVLALDLTIPTVEASAGASGVVIDVVFSAATEMRSAGFDIAYDQTKLTYKSFTTDPAFNFSSVSALAGGKVRAFIGGGAAASVTSVVKLVFDVAADATGSYPLTFIEGTFELKDADGNNIVYTPKNGSLTILQKPKVTATATPPEGGTITIAGTVDVGATPTCTVAVNPSYRVLPTGGFKVSNDLTAQLVNNSYTLLMLKAGDNVTVDVYFEIIPEYVVSASSDANGTISNAGDKTYKAGETPKYIVTPNKNYEIDTFTVSTDDNAKLTDAGDGTFTYTFAPLASNASISVTLKLKQYKVTSTAGANGTIAPVGEKTYAAGSTPSYTVTPAAGYMVDTFKVNGADAAAALTPITDGKAFTYAFAALEAEATVDVTFKLAKNTVKVTLNPVEGAVAGTVTPAPDAAGEVKFDPGTAAALTVTANSGYAVSEVKIDGIKTLVETSGVYTLAEKIAKDYTFEVTFVKAKMWKVKASAKPAEGGIIDPAVEKEVAEGGSQAYTLKANATWLLDKVTVNGVVRTDVTGTVTTFTVSDIKADTEVVVFFKKDGKYSSADYNYDYEISLLELLRVSELYNNGSYSCKAGTVDGYTGGGVGDAKVCAYHTSDYDSGATGSKQDWKIELSEFLRVIQFYNVGGYKPQAGTEDNFAPSATK